MPGFTEISAGLWEVMNLQCSFVRDLTAAAGIPGVMPIGMLFRFEMQLVDSDLGVIPDTQTSFWVRRNDPSLVPDWEVRGLRLGGPGGSPLPGSGTQSDPFVADQIGMGFPPYPFKAQLTLEGTVNDLNKQVARHTANAATYLEDGTQIEPSRFRCANEGGTIDDEHEPWVTGGPPADLEKASLFDLSDLYGGVFINPGCLGSSLPPGAGTSTVRLEMQLVDHDLEVIPDTQTSFWVKFVAPAEDEDTGTG